MSRELEPSAHLTSEEGTRAAAGTNHQQSMIESATDTEGVWRASWLVSIWTSREGGMAVEGIEAVRPFPIPCPLHPLHVAAPESYPL